MENLKIIRTSNLMKVSEVLAYPAEGKNFLIIGPPASGKTWLCHQLDKGNHTVIHTDKYVTLGYQLGLYAALNDVAMSDKPTLVEGVQGYRMLRKGVEYASYYPDAVIEITADNYHIQEVYRQERDPKKLAYLKSFNEKHDKILSEYLTMCPPEKKPYWINVYNTY